MAPADRQSIVHSVAVQHGKPHRVLILDDEPAILFAYRRIIENEGMHVDSSTCLEDALTYISTHNYLAIVTDVRLSGSENKDGLELLRIVRQSRPTTKVIMATGFGTAEIQDSARQLGAEHFFIKPIQPASIVNALRDFAHTSAAATS
jgi:DNA-binding NtrC family response regulator